jgi:DNA-binding GntR family transcriptional regulator
MPSETTGADRVKRSLLDDVHERVAEYLADPTLQPGSPVRIDHLARLWGVSQTPIREALARAEASGLVRREAHRGYRVAELLPPAEFDRLMELRLLLEPWCAAQAALHADEVADALRAEHEAMRRAPLDTYREYLRADVAFHDVLVRAAGNRFLQAALDLARPHAHRFRRFAVGVDDADEAIAEHQRVLDAVLAGDPVAAEAAMRAHLEGVRRRSV